jgi:hypothetical protein
MKLNLRKKADETKTLPQDTEAEIKGIPVEFIKVDEKTGELCVGEDCFKVKYEPIENTIAIEIDPEAPCSPLMTKVAKQFLKQIVEGRPKFKIREKRKLE